MTHARSPHLTLALLVGVLEACGSQAEVASGTVDSGPTRDAANGVDGPSSTERDASASGDAAANADVNIVFILADDFSWNLVDAMPEVQRMQAEGITFSQYLVSNSLCCPARASLLTGKFPHNTGVLTNSGSEGGYATFSARGNEATTFALALQTAGYRTAMLGKYLNGYEPDMKAIPAGWTHWAVAGNGYAGLNYDLNQDGKVVHYGSSENDYMTDVLSRLGTELIEQSVGSPFLIELAAFAPHAPYVPAARDADKFLDAKAPRSPAFGARPTASAPAWLRAIPALTNPEIATLDNVHRLRLQAVQAIDAMVGEVRATLAARGLADRTYVVFASDNGYHLGEHSLRAGKQTAFDVDIRVPLIVVGPNVPQGRVVQEITQNVDLCPTFRELAGLIDSDQVNGRSLVPFLRDESPLDWRDVAFVEHKQANTDPGDPDMQKRFNADPPSYAALRSRDALYVEYETGELEYYDRIKDPEELENVAAALDAASLAKLHAALEASKTCTDAASCWSAQHLP